VARLRDSKDFGLVFERHLPETLRLLTHPIRIGCKVHERTDTASPLWAVVRIAGGDAELHRRDGDEEVREIWPVRSLVVVQEFGEPVYPGFKRIVRVANGEEKPSHVVINGENYHALETLVYSILRRDGGARQADQPVEAAPPVRSTTTTAVPPTPASWLVQCHTVLTRRVGADFGA
jgi:hypothetical protein